MTETPFFDQNHPDSSKLQEVWVARVRVFELPTEQEDYAKVWQRVTDGHAKMAESQTHFIPERGVYVALLRWIDLTYKVPQT